MILVTFCLVHGQLLCSVILLEFCYIASEDSLHISAEHFTPLCRELMNKRKFVVSKGCGQSKVLPFPVLVCKIVYIEYLSV